VSAPSGRGADAIVEHLGEIGIGILTVRYGGRIIDANDAAQRMLGRSIADLTELADVAELIAPDDRFTRVEERAQRRAGLGSRIVYHVETVRADGTSVPVDIVVVPLPDVETGETGRMAAMLMRDDSAHEERIASLRRYESLVERLPYGVVVCDVVGTGDEQRLVLHSANAAAVEIAGYDLNSRAGERIEEIYGRQTTASDLRRQLEMVGTGRVEAFPDIVVGGPGERQRVFEITVVDLEIGGSAIVLDDVTGARHEDAVRRELLRRMVGLVDNERRAIALGIHDDPLQQLAAATMLVEHSRRGASDEIGAPLAAAEDALRSAMSGLRQFVFELSPPELIEGGLEAAIRRAADHLFSNSETLVTIECDLPDDPPTDVLDTAFRIIVEALTNTRKHARAGSVSVLVDTRDGGLVLDVTDDGRGGSGDDGRHAAPDRPGHLGLRAMRDRAAAIGGWCLVVGTEQGTQVSAWLPKIERQPAHDTDLATTLNGLDSATESLVRQLGSLRVSHQEAVVRETQVRSVLGTVIELERALAEAPGVRDAATVAAVACRWIASGTETGCAIRLIDGDRLHYVASHHDDPEQRSYLERSIFVERDGARSYSAMVRSTGKAMLIDRERAEWLLADGSVPPPAPHEIHTAIIAPLRQAGVIVGVITMVRDRHPARFTSSDLGWVGVMCDVVAAHLPTEAGR
jgi:PAS domain S-box-containing protein